MWGDQMSMDSEDVSTIVEILEGQLNKHGNLEAARQFAAKLRFPGATIEAAIRVLGDRRKIFDTLEPAPISDGNQRWYFGPSANSLYWPTYVKRLESIGWTPDMIGSLDGTTSRALDLLEPPGNTKIGTRGLVVGRVQSGKTGHFTGLIAKAADSGYKLFIVLSGITNSLRLQTQKRLGRDLSSTERPGSWYWLTRQEIFGDFESHHEANVDVALKGGALRSIAVVKKQSQVLRALIDWLREGNEMLRRECPVLIIDDEADQASLNTSPSMAREELSRINSRIVELMSATNFPRCAYVGYTATPFANVLVNTEFPENLYPRSFIYPLNAPKTYFGSERVHGRARLSPDEPDEITDGLAVVRTVPIEELPKLRPSGQKLDGFNFEVTPTLKTALRYFFLATAARLFREDKGSRQLDFSTMLVHTSHRVAVHQQSLVEARKVVEELRREANEKKYKEWQVIWKREMDQIDRDKLGAQLGEVQFNDLAPYLFAAIDRTKLIVSNSMKNEEANVTFDEKGQIAIVIGGNTLSRGLTLEGLIVSYFARSANAYDTILQMGRWFGYRPYYEDLPRIWMTAEMQGHFHDLATIEEEFREQLEDYRAQGLTPMQAAMRIRKIPKLRITAANKMRFAETADIGYGGARPQTIHFNPSKTWLEQNVRAASGLIAKLGKPAQVDRGRHVWRGCDASKILDFLGEYQFHQRSRELDRALIQQYIHKQNKVGGLKTWNVVVAGLEKPNSALGTLNLGVDTTANCINRSRLKFDDETVINIKALMSPSDILIDQPDYEPAKYEGRPARELFSLREEDPSGVLILYPISKDSSPQRIPSKTRMALGTKVHVVGVAILFPEGRGHGSSDDYVQANLAPVESVVSGEAGDEDNDGEEASTS